MIPQEVSEAVRDHPYPLVFATISGAHLYGFPSPNSDWDIRGVHVLRVEQVVGLLPFEETVELAHEVPVELDLVTHDLRKFILLMLRPNGYVLEQLMSPLVLHSTPEYRELQSSVPACLTRHHAHHYLGFADNQWKLFRKEKQPRVKPLLYSFRVLLTGIHLMRSGEVEANLEVLNSMYPVSFLPDLIARKREGAEQQTLALDSLPAYERDFYALRNRLEAEYASTGLQEFATARQALHDLLVRTRCRH